ncbi:MAG TPA: PA14 domain-containing protein, partial [Tepidisphaeraceae bacterium]|nr:PA14 domain-containing protein [Tepidisphaeraceae bacterium]
GEVRLAQLRFKLIPWGPTQSGESCEGGLAELKSQPDPAPGTYLLGLEVPRLGNAPLRRAQWLLFAAWKLEFRPVVRFDEIRMDSSPNDRDLTGVVGPVYQTLYAPALALQDGLAVRTARPNRLQWFTVTATARAHFAAGRYRFSTTSDDGARLWVDGAKVIDNWRPHPPATTDGYVDLTEGDHELRAELFQETGGFSLWIQAAPMTAAARTTALALGGGVPEADWQAIWTDQLTAEFPNERRFPLLRAQALVRGGRFEEARQQYQRLAELNPGMWDIAAEQIPLLAYLKDGLGYQRACASEVDRLEDGSDPHVRIGLIQACCISSQAPITVAQLHELLGDQPPAGVPPELAARWHLAAGMAQVRIGDFSTAVGNLAAALSALPQNVPAARATAETFLSMALLRLGRGEAGREALDRADQLMAKLPIAGVDDLDHAQAADWLACHTIRREIASAAD